MSPQVGDGVGDGVGDRVGDGVGEAWHTMEHAAMTPKAVRTAHMVMTA